MGECGTTTEWIKINKKKYVMGGYGHSPVAALAIGMWDLLGTVYSGSEYMGSEFNDPVDLKADLERF